MASNSRKTATGTQGHIDVEERGAVLVARIDGGPHALFDAALAKQLKSSLIAQTATRTFMRSSSLARTPIDS
jgi:hypothetical protein